MLSGGEPMTGEFVSPSRLCPAYSCVQPCSRWAAVRSGHISIAIVPRVRSTPERSETKGAAALVESGTIHLISWKCLLPQEQVAVPIGRTVPSRRRFAAYAELQRSHTPTTRLWLCKAITPAAGRNSSHLVPCAARSEIRPGGLVLSREPLQQVTDHHRGE